MTKTKHIQWAVNGGGRFSPAGETCPTLAPAMYKVNQSPFGTSLERQELQTDDLIVLEDSPAHQVISNIRKFWNAQDSFASLGLLHKRGVLMYGVPGCGKTATVEILAKDVIADDGIVLLVEDGQEAQDGLKMIRGVEPTCKIVVIMEDLDGWVRSKGEESQLSNLLDGENQVENVVYVATTNFIDKIPARLKNRPSRFDEVLEVHLPGADIRRGYLKAKTAGMLTDEDVEQWTAATDNFAVSHLRELIVGVLALNRPFDEVLARLKKMVGAGPELAQKGAQA